MAGGLVAAPFPGSPAAQAGTFHLFRGYEPGREDTLVLIANFPRGEGLAAGGQDLLFAEPAVYGLHLDQDGDGSEDLTFRFRWHAATAAAAAFYTLDQVRGPFSAPEAVEPLRAWASGEERFTAPGAFLRPDPFPDEGAYEAYAAGFIHEVELPGCGAGRVFVGPRRQSPTTARRPSQRRGSTDALATRWGKPGRFAGLGVTSLAVEIPLGCLEGGGEAIDGWTSVVKPRGESPVRLGFGRSLWTDPVGPYGSELKAEFPYLSPPLPTDSAAPEELSPASAAAISCRCPSPYYICWFYAMMRAGYTPSYCPNAIHSGKFGAIDKAYMTQADIIQWGGHAGYISSSGSGYIVVDEFNRNGVCELLLNQYYYAPGYSGASQGWVRRPPKVSLKTPTNGTGGLPATLSLTWNAAYQADGYELEVSRNSSFTDLVYDGDVYGLSKQLTLAGSTTYHWRVLGFRGPYGGTRVYSEGGVSEAWSFSTAAPCSSVAAPVISASLENSHPKLTWSSVSGADRYKVYRRYTDPNGTFYYAGETTGTSWVDPYNVTYSGHGFKIYVYYKVKSVNDGPSCSPPYESAFSNQLRFTCEEGLE